MHLREIVKLQLDTHEEREIITHNKMDMITYHHATSQRNASAAVCIRNYVTIADAQKRDRGQPKRIQNVGELFIMITLITIFVLFCFGFFVCK